VRIYLAGPMTGLPHFNFPAFDDGALALRTLGHEVCNPAEHDREMHGDRIEASKTGNPDDARRVGFSLREALAYDLDWIARNADAVGVLPGWESSKGANAEVALAHALGLLVAPFDAFVSARWDNAEPALPDCSTRINPPTLPGKVAPREIRAVSSTGGEKGVKPARFDLLPSYPLHVVAEHYAKGAAKYSAHNWRRGYEWSNSFAALMRHAWAFWDGEDYDADGYDNLAAAAFHTFTLMQFARDFPGFDDRYKEILA